MKDSDLTSMRRLAVTGEIGKQKTYREKLVSKINSVQENGRNLEVNSVGEWNN